MFVAGIISLFTMAAASAETVPNSMTLTIGGGNYYFASKRQLDNAAFPFGAIGYNFTKQWGVELLGAFFNTDSHLPADNGKKVNGTLFVLDGMYHFSNLYSLDPYVMLGPGVLGLSPNGNDANNQANLNGGVGLQYFFNKAVSLRLEARDFYTIIGGKNDYYLDAAVSVFIPFC